VICVSVVCLFVCLCLSVLCVIVYPISTKIEALMEELEMLADADPSAKGIVFSQVGFSYLDENIHKQTDR
jgi:hypothetical protein